LCVTFPPVLALSLQVVKFGRANIWWFSGFKPVVSMSMISILF